MVVIVLLVMVKSELNDTDTANFVMKFSLLFNITTLFFKKALRSPSEKCHSLSERIANHIIVFRSAAFRRICIHFGGVRGVGRYFVCDHLRPHHATDNA